MEILGFLLITFAIWCGYCGFESYNPFTLFLAIVTNPGRASELMDSASQQSQSAIAVAPEGTAYASGGTLYDQLSNPGTSQALGGVYGPFSNYRISRSFQAHVAGHSTAPGVDFVMPVGTPLYTPFSGTVIDVPNANPAAGNMVEVKLSNGDVFSIKHVSAFATSLNGQHVNAGQEIALSGGQPGTPGAGDATGPHAHVDLRTPSGQYVPFYSVPFG